MTGVNMDPAVCGANTLLNAVTTCDQAVCKECQPPPPCNPITNEGCDTAGGEACDFNGAGFQCFPAPNDTDLCGMCDNQNGPFCKPGMHCAQDMDGNANCAAYCCDDADCGKGKCDKTVLGDPAIGICLKP